MITVIRNRFNELAICFGLILFLSHTQTIAQDYYVEITFSESGSTCNNSNDCTVTTGKFNSTNIPVQSFNDTYKINSTSAFPSNFTVSGKIDCTGEVLHCNIFSDAGTMPAPNNLKVFETGYFYYCREYAMAPPSATGGGCANSDVSLTISTLGDNHLWQASINNGTTWTNIPSANSRECTVTKSTLESMFGNLYGVNIYFRCLITDCYSRNSNSSSPVIFYVPAPTATFTPTDPSCHDGNDGQIQVNINSSSPSLVNDFKIDLYDAGGIIGNDEVIDGFIGTLTSLDVDVPGLGIPSGTYSVIVYNNTNTSELGSCPSVLYGGITVNNPSLVTIPTFNISNYNGFEIKCNGDSNGSIEAIPSGGSGNYTEYTWTPAVSVTSTTTSSKASGLTAGPYKVKAKDSKGCWSVEYTNTLDQPIVATVSLASTGGADGYGVSCTAVPDGRVVATGSSDVAGYSYSWTTGPTGSTITGLTGGGYTVTMTDANGCTDTKSITLTVRPDVNFSIQEINPIECPGKPTGSLEVQSITNASTPISYLWTSGETTSSIANKAPGDYILEVTDGKGCKASETKTLVNPSGYSVSIDPLSDYFGSRIKCNGNNDGELGTVVRNLDDTDGDNITSASHYTWYKNAVYHNDGVALNSIDLLSAATYKVVIEYGTNCTAENIFFLDDPDPVLPVVSISSDYNGHDITCPGASDGSLHAVGGGGTGSSYSFVWNTGTLGADLTGKIAGTYSVTATDVNGCTGSDSETLNDPPPINPSVSITSSYNGLPLSCHDASDGKLKASAIGGAGSFTFSWNTGATGTDLNNIPSGTYTVTAKDANNCTATASKTIINPDPVTASISILSDFNGQAISCYNAVNGSLRVSALGGAGSYSYTWSTGFTGADLSGIGAGTYSVTARDANNCPSALVSKTLNNPDPVIASISILSDYNGKPISCYGAEDGSIRASATGGTETFTYTWNTGDTGADLTGLGENTYTVTAFDENSCPSIANTTLNDPDPVVATITAISEYNGYGIKCVGDNNGYLEAAGSGGTGGFSFVWVATTETSFRLSDVGEGTYQVIVTDINGCDDDASAAITKPPVLSLSVIGKQNITCYDGNDGTISLEATGGVGGYEYERDTQGLQSSSQFSGLKALTYVFKTVDDNGCIAIKSDSLSQPSQIVISFDDVEPAFCADPRGRATAVVTGGTGSTYRFEWRNSSNVLFDTDDLIENLSAGVYTLTTYDVRDCKAVNSVGITSTDGPVVSMTENVSAKCSYSSDGSALLEVTNGNSPFTFLWPDGQTDSRGINLAKGSYQVTVTDTYNCVTVKTVDISAPEALAIDLIETTLPSCNGFCDGKLKVAAQGGAGAYSYLWGSVSGDEITSICMGSHSVKVTDGNGCEAENTFPLGEPTPLQINLVSRQLPSCNGYCDGTIVVEASGANGNYQYSWSAGPIAAKAENMCAGDHIVTVKDVKGCQLSRTYQLGQPEVLQARLVRNTRPSCYLGCDGSLAIEAFGGNGNYQYTWAQGTSGSEITNICAGDHTVTIKDGKGCELKDRIFSLTQPEALKARVIKSQQPSCNGDCDGSLEVEAFGGNGNYQYQWVNGPATALINNICAGNYAVTVTDAKSCILKDEIFSLGQPELLQVRLAQMDTPTCHDGCDGSLTAEASGGNGSYQYTWITGTTGAKAEGLCVHDYSVSVTDAKACRTSDTYTVANTPKLTIDLGGSVTLCVGQTHVLDAGSAWSSYKWGSNTGITANTSKITIKEAGQYWVELFNNDGCIAQDTFLLETSLDLLKANLILTTQAIVGDTIVIIDVSWPLPENIIWEYPAAMRKIVDLGDIVYGQFDEPGIYQIKLTALLGECRDDMTKSITILRGEDEPEGGRLGHDKFVKEFELYPNPNDGSFDVSIELAEESPVTLSVWSIPNSIMQGKITDNGKKTYLKHVDLRPLPSGNYILRLDHKKGKEYIRFIVN